MAKRGCDERQVEEHDFQTRLCDPSCSSSATYTDPISAIGEVEVYDNILFVDSAADERRLQMLLRSKRTILWTVSHRRGAGYLGYR